MNSYLKQLKEQEIKEELLFSEKIIKREISKYKNIETSYIPFGLINSKWYEEYLLFLNNSKSEEKNEKIYNIEFIESICEKKDYSYVSYNQIFNLPINFVFTTSKFLKLLSDKFKYKKDKERIERLICPALIGEEFIIIKLNSKKSSPFCYIILFDENKKNINNNIDYILKIEDRPKRLEACKIYLEK